MISDLPGDAFQRLANADQYERFIARTLNDQAPAWDEHWDPEAFVSTCRVHGVSALIASAQEDATCIVPETVSGPLAELLASHKVFDVLHRERLGVLWRELNRQGVRAILLKGGALSLTIYSRPWLRSRGDTDLVIDERDRSKVDVTLRQLGYAPFFESQMQTASYQRAYTLTDDYGFEHTFDIHWRLSNRQIFAAALPWSDLVNNTTSTADGDLEILTLNQIYQMLHLCAHRTTHLTSPQFSRHLTPSGDRLLWLYDLYLVSRDFNEDQWNELADISQHKQISSIVHGAITTASEWFPINLPQTTAQRMQAAGRHELARHLLTRSRLRTLLVDILALPHWRTRLGMLFDAAFPPPDQMLSIYGKRHRAWLPLLYMHRLVGLRP